MTEPDITEDPKGWVIYKTAEHLRVNRDKDDGRATELREESSDGALAMEYYYRGRAEALDLALSWLEGLQQGSGMNR